MRSLGALLIVIVLAASVAACGSSNGASTGSAAGGAAATTSSTHFAKTKFVLHAGLAFGAFHRYIYKPLKQGKFSGGLFHHKVATIKAALAAAFAYHEVKLALKDARSSKILSKALSPLLSLQTKLAALGTGLKHGNVDASGITAANSDASKTSQLSATAGQPISDQATPALGG